MGAVITALHVIVCIFLVAVVLLQRGKGAQVGAVFGGGGGATMFGGRGAGNFLTKLTTGAAAIYMATSLTLSYLGISGDSDRLFQDGVIEQEGAPQTSIFEELGTVPADETPVPTDTAPAETPEEAPAP
jgi:preprotein translocase subunit SecG